MAASISPQIRVFLVKDEPVTREGLRLLLNSQPGITVVGEVSSCSEGIAAALRERPDIILMDINLADERGITCIREIRSVAAPAQIIILSGADNLELHLSAISHGAKGLVRKSETSDVLVKAIRRVHAGEVWLDGLLMARILNELWLLLAASQGEVVAATPDHIPIPQPEVVKVNGGPPGAESAKIALLTEREREIVVLIGLGLRNKEIADRLFISVVTVRHHLSSVFEKLEVSDRFGLAIYAFRYGLAEIPDSTNIPYAK
ncbi:MAG TPA: response regulator transcription factor [Blastocatellia bacterium]|nr:response regulator transcription factor [Blastocatellia bacterium]